VFQELVDETNSRLKKVEDEHREQQRVMDSVVHELEKRIQLLKTEIEANIQIKNQLADEKNHLSQINDALNQRLKDQEMRERSLESEMKRLRERHEADMNAYQGKMELQISKLKADHDAAKQKVRFSSNVDFWFVSTFVSCFRGRSIERGK
jgi:hypothetical protein